MRLKTFQPVQENNLKLPQAVQVKYLDLNLDRRPTWLKHIPMKCKQSNIVLNQMYWLVGRKSQISLENKLLQCKVIRR